MKLIAFILNMIYLIAIVIIGGLIVDVLKVLWIQRNPERAIKLGGMFNKE